jgi:hypothetical protein
MCDFCAREAASLLASQILERIYPKTTNPELPNQSQEVPNDMK